MPRARTVGIGAAALLVVLSSGLAEKPKPAVGPRTPQEEKTTFRLAPGFRIELVAHEPNVIDPVSMCFDEDGRLLVAEMHGYPNGGVGTGEIKSGVIKVLEDKDGDGFYETSRVFADGLRFPMGMMPYRGGLIVTQAPDILFLEDTKGKGKADRRRVLYTGFALGNIQQMINTPQWGLDNWVYCCAGLTGGDVRSIEKPDAPIVSLRGRGARFRPDVPASLEPTSGGGQYGLTCDEYQRWFVNTNSQHLRHIVLPDHYLRRNPALAVSAVTLDIPEHGAACKVFRISPFEAWRVERTTRRVNSELAKKLPPTELVPGGYVTSGCSPCYYAASSFPPSHLGSIFSCDPANNLILRDGLRQRGATFSSYRADPEFEFLASTDNWFRPVHLSVGPDGSLFVLDFYREVIETPLSLPDDMKKNLNLESQKRGRIWRIVAEGAPKCKKPALSSAAADQLVETLNHPNIWWRMTAQRLLMQRKDRSIVPALRRLATAAKTGPGRAHALWALHGLSALDDQTIIAALKDREAGVREQGLRFADERIARSREISEAVCTLINDPDPRVRFQLAFTLGESDASDSIAALATIVLRDVSDPWTMTAVLSSTSRCAPGLLLNLIQNKRFIQAQDGACRQFLTRLAAMVGSRADDKELAEVLVFLKVEPGKQVAPWQFALLDGLTQGLRNSPRSPTKFWADPPIALRDAVDQARTLFVLVAERCRDASRPVADRVTGLGILAGGPFASLERVVPELLAPQAPVEVQLAAVRALAAHDHSQVSQLLLANWSAYSPAVRREVLEGLFARAERLPALLDAIERKTVLAIQIDPSRLEQLRRHRDRNLRERAGKLLGAAVAPERQKVVDTYRSVLDLASDRTRGKVVFKRVCASCHRLENEGHQVGADLLSALGNKTREQLLIDILDPSREVDPRYLNYVVNTKRGQTLTGLIAVETATSVTLRRGDGQEDTVLRTQIDEIRATAKSVMPDGLETQLTRQDVADVIAYLRSVAMPR